MEKPEGEPVDVLVIGGGPAGAVSALVMVRLGLRVTLCDAEGLGWRQATSLSGGVRQQLAHLGLGQVLEDAAHLGIMGIRRRWAQPAFVEVDAKDSFVCDRAVLDARLLEAAAEAGVHVLRPAVVLATRREASSWVVTVRLPSGRTELRAGLVVDAAGRQSRSRPRLERGAKTLAISGRWAGWTTSVMQISSAPNAWFWTAPAAAGGTTVIAFADPRTLRKAAGGIRERYLALLEGSGLDPPGRLDAKPEACDCTPYDILPSNRGLLHVGDAATALDPLSSSGVQAAIASAMSVGPVARTLCATSGDHEAAWRFWENRRRSRADQHRSWSGAHYAEACDYYCTPFWQLRSPPPQPARAATRPGPAPAPVDLIALSAQVGFEQQPCLVDDWVQRRECVVHPHLEEAVAFVGTAPVAPLLRRLASPRLASDVLVEWSALVGHAEAWRLLTWSWQNSILVAAR